VPAQVEDKQTIGISAPVRSEAFGSNPFGEERRRTAMRRKLCPPSPSPISPVLDCSREQGSLSHKHSIYSMSGAEPDCEARDTLVMEKQGLRCLVVWEPDTEFIWYCMECADASPMV